MTENLFILINLLLVNLFNFQFLKRWVVKNKGRRWNAKTVVNISYLIFVSFFAGLHTKKIMIILTSVRLCSVSIYG